jgi:DUF971 family protein
MTEKLKVVHPFENIPAPGRYAMSIAFSQELVSGLYTAAYVPGPDLHTIFLKVHFSHHRTYLLLCL